MGIVEKIQEIEREIARTQKNKATEYHLGLLKAKLAKYRQQLLEPTGKAGAKGEGFDVMKSGDARVAMVGFPSVGKSTFLSTVTKTESVAASYEFTTLTCIPGVIEYQGANIQLLDLPGIIEGAAQGKGRGRQVIAVAKTSDLILMMLDATKGDKQRELLERELEEVGIRLNRRRPGIYFKRKPTGGVKFTRTAILTHCNEKMVMNILHEYKIFNADVVFREDCTVDEFIDVIQGNRVYLKCLYVYNKIDQISIDELDRIARQPHSVVISCEMNLNMDFLLRRIWEYLALIRIYTKKPGSAPDLGVEDGIILRGDSTIEHACHALHRTLASQFRYAIVWGTSTKFSPQRVGIKHKLHHEDVVQIVKNRWQDLDKQSKAEKKEKDQLKNAFRLSDDMYISPEKPSDVLPQKAYEDQTSRDAGSMPIELQINHTMLRYVDHSFDNKRRVKRYEHFQLLQYDQRFIAERLLFLGADLAAAHFLVHRGASVKFVGDSHWYTRKNGDLPGRKVDGLYIEAIDASRTELMFEGFDNLYDLHHLRMLRLADCKYIDDWSLSRIGGVCSSLELLDLSGCNRISGKGLLALRTLRNLKSLRLERMNNQTDLGKSALLLEEALPHLQVVGLDYDAALECLEAEKQLLSDDRTLIDAKGNVFVEDDNGALYYVAGKINERATVNEEDQPIMTSTIRRDLPEMDEIEFERLDRLSKGRLRHLLVGSPSGYMWSDQVETILAHEAKLDKKDGRLTDSKMLPLAERLERLNQLGVDPNTLINANSNEQISESEKNSKQAAGNQ
ncbi:hypothetical protein M3Y98_00957800 [Aphelenchoides besseyi]|nr:hypothetical protein M3Y98_00957800 [Aphelenchoides besseyi]